MAHRTVYALRVDQLRGIGQVGPAALQHVAEAETKFEFGNQFEERQIEVAAEARFEKHLRGLRAQQRVLARREVIHIARSGQDIGAIVVEARRGGLQVGGKAHIGRLHVLRLALGRGALHELYMLRAEVQAGRQTQTQIAPQAPLAEHAYGEAEVLRVVLGHPLSARGGVYVAAAREREALVVQPDAKAVVKAALVDEGLVLHAAFLRRECRRKGKKGRKKGREAGVERRVHA